ncbi:hypothetical protein [Azospirillum sp. A39]|uniref:hypothetical protein n=1 Tax=Azospirillum sp. A39 TaxID=3462279 RepID=UPI00404560FC
METGDPAEPSPLLDAESPAASCPAACERSFRICMDSVAARPSAGTTEQFGMSSTRPFTATDDCQYELGRCLQRCPTSTSP